MSALHKNPKKRVSLFIHQEMLSRVESWAGARGTSRNQALLDLIGLGLDASAAGADTRAELDARLRDELRVIRALVAESIYSSDSCVRLVLDLFEDIDVESEFRIARAWAKSEARKLKAGA